MLIISKFRDYYDSALAGGVDKTIVYRRKTEEIYRPEWMNRKNYFPELINTKSWHGGLYMDYEDVFHAKLRQGRYYEYNIKVFVIGFCGKVYKGVRLQLGQHYMDKEYNPTYHYTALSLAKEMSRLLITYDQKDTTCFDFTPVDCPQMIKDRCISFFEIGERTPKIMRQEQLHKRWDSDPRAYTNPVLKDYQFYRVVDSYAALQEIMMYISGVIGVGEKETIKISDKDMRDAKGFNKWSFKNPIRVRDLK